MENLEEYLSNGVENIVKSILKASLKNPNASMFMLRYIDASKKARKTRIEYDERGEHIPPFLIASITSQCNLHCKGCYARANNSCSDHSNRNSLTASQWGDIMNQADSLGISFILLAGGEPFTRPDILEEAGRHSHIIFPIFTNGTMIDKNAVKFLVKNPNLMPVVSIEGNKETTDGRRGDGIYASIQLAMEKMKKFGVLFGASVTVTKDNVNEVFDEKFINYLKDVGAKAIVYVEYVPVDNFSDELAPDDNTRKYMEQRMDTIRTSGEELLLIAFPGDEKTSGGCLAAGRGFFHINAQGGAEPCPFSPYSDTNVTETPLLQALKSPLFVKLRELGVLMESHDGGCVLFNKEEQVKELMGPI
ncbi:MAG: radical SAM protein [Lachnotalea sp.]